MVDPDGYRVIIGQSLARSNVSSASAVQILKQLDLDLSFRLTPVYTLAAEFTSDGN